MKSLSVTVQMKDTYTEQYFPVVLTMLCNVVITYA